jgi:hypothetical protein
VSFAITRRVRAACVDAAQSVSAGFAGMGNRGLMRHAGCPSIPAPAPAVMPLRHRRKLSKMRAFSRPPHARMRGLPRPRISEIGPYSEGDF